MMMRDVLRQIYNRHCWDLRGRVGRAPFWRFVRAALVLYGAAWIFTFSVSQIAHRTTPAMNCVLSLVALSLLPPLAGMGARRLRDVHQSGLLVLTLLIPVAILLVTGTLANEPFMLPDFRYFYFTFQSWIDFVACVALVSLVSFWMQAAPLPGQADAT